MSDRTRPDRDRSEPEPERDGTSSPVGDGHDLDTELRRLFGDDRLSVPVARGAGDAVVAGARRRRRNRMAMAAGSGVLAATAIVFAGVALTGIGRPAAITPASPLLSTTSDELTTSPGEPPSTSAIPSPTGQAMTLGPKGVGVLTLGMSVAEAQMMSAALAAQGKRIGSCVLYTWRFNVDAKGVPTHTLVLPPTSTEPPETDATGKVPGATVSGGAVPSEGAASTFDPLRVALVVGSVEVDTLGKGEIVRIIAGPKMTTPEGVGVGSSLKDVLVAYAKSAVQGVREKNDVTVEAPGNPGAMYVFQLDAKGLVTQFALESKDALACPF